MLKYKETGSWPKNSWRANIEGTILSLQESVQILTGGWQGIVVVLFARGVLSEITDKYSLDKLRGRQPGAQLARL